MLETGGLIVVIVALCEAVKRAGLKGKYVPLLAVILGLAGSLYFDGVNFLATASGVVSGLTAVGGYSLVKGLTKEY